MPSLPAVEELQSKQQQQHENQEHQQLKRNPQRSQFRKEQHKQQHPKQQQPHRRGRNEKYFLQRNRRKIHSELKKIEQKVQAAEAQASTTTTTQHHAKYQNRCHYILKGFPLLTFSLLLVILNALNCSGGELGELGKTDTSIAFVTTNANANVGAEQQEPNNHPTYFPPSNIPLPQQPQHQSQNLQEQPHQNKQLMTTEASPVSSNQTFKSLSRVDAARRDYTDVAITEPGMRPIVQQPAFDYGMPYNVTARTGQAEATIKCRVAHLRDKSVSWIRKRDLHILSVGTSTYTSDKRFEVTASKDTRDWTLHVKSPQPRDSGVYECQVNTEPKTSMAFQLSVIVIPTDSRAIISGPLDQHFKVGSTVMISCFVEQPTLKQIGRIYWYRGEQLLTPIFNPVNDIDAETAKMTPFFQEDDADAATAFKDEVHREIEKEGEERYENDIDRDLHARISMEYFLGDIMKSRLRIANARTTDTGNYTCQPATANSASVMIHVINDESPAAMQKSAATSMQTLTLTFYGLPLAVVSLLLQLLLLVLLLPIVLGLVTDYIFNTYVICR